MNSIWALIIMEYVYILRKEFVLFVWAVSSVQNMLTYV